MKFHGFSVIFMDFHGFSIIYITFRPYFLTENRWKGLIEAVQSGETASSLANRAPGKLVRLGCSNLGSIELAFYMLNEVS